ncbi:hypothetical protein Tco_0231954 [Tanacetum coccineum]
MLFKLSAEGCRLLATPLGRRIVPNGAKRRSFQRIGADPTTETYDVEAIRQAHPEEITATEWDKYIKFWNDPKNLARAEEMKRLDAMGEYTEDEINAFAIGGKLRGHIPGVGRWAVLAGVTGCGDDEDSGDDEDDDGVEYLCDLLLVMTTMVLIKPKESPATCRWGKVCHRGTNCLTEKHVGPTSSLGIIAGDCIPDEYSPATCRWG